MINLHEDFYTFINSVKDMEDFYSISLESENGFCIRLKFSGMETDTKFFHIVLDNLLTHFSNLQKEDDGSNDAVERKRYTGKFNGFDLVIKTSCDTKQNYYAWCSPFFETKFYIIDIDFISKSTYSDEEVRELEEYLRAHYLTEEKRKEMEEENKLLKGEL